MTEGVEIRGFTVAELIDKLKQYPPEQLVVMAMADQEETFSKVTRVDQRMLRTAAAEDVLYDFVSWNWPDRIAATGPERQFVVIDFAQG